MEKTQLEHRTCSHPDGESGRVLPADMADWIGHERLSRLVHRAVIKAGPADIDPPAVPVDLDRFSPRAVLAVMVYSYASGCYSSRAIFERGWTDRFLLHLGGGRLPRRPTMTGFRRQHRQLLQECLCRVLEAGWRVHHISRDLPQTAPGALHAARKAVEVQPWMRHQLLLEAHERILRASLLDSISIDL